MQIVIRFKRTFTVNNNHPHEGMSDNFPCNAFMFLWLSLTHCYPSVSLRSLPSPVQIEKTVVYGKLRIYSFFLILVSKWVYMCTNKWLYIDDNKLNMFDALTCLKMKYQHLTHLLILVLLALRVFFILWHCYVNQCTYEAQLSPSGVQFQALSFFKKKFTYMKVWG